MATKKFKGLGRGLEALLGPTVDDSAAAMGPSGPGFPASLLLTDMVPGQYQPRTRMDEGALYELAESIKAQGIMQPILVRRLSDEQGRLHRKKESKGPSPAKGPFVDAAPDRPIYEIIAGERRFRAAKLAGLDSVPVLVRDVPDESAAAMGLIENIQREDLNPLEEATGIQRLIDEFDMTHDVAAQAVGRSRSAVTNLLRLLNLSKAVQDLLMQGKLEMGHARALLSVSGPRQADLAYQIVSRRLSVREVELLVSQADVTSQKTFRKQPRKDRDVQALEEELSNILGTSVSVNTARGGRGKLTINYASLDQLEIVLQKLRN